MIKSLEELAQEREFDRKRYGDKAVLLAELIVDMEEQNFRCVKPYGYVVDNEEVDWTKLRGVFEDLSSRINTKIDGKKIGAIFCRSSAYREYSGANESIPVRYNETYHEKSWQDFKDAFIKVREQGGLKPVLLQNLVGEITSKELRVTRKLHEYDWPGLPGGIHPIDIKLKDIPVFRRLTTNAIIEAIKKGGIDLSKEYKKHSDSLQLSLYVEGGPIIDNITLNDMLTLQEGHYLLSMLFVIANQNIEDQGYSRNHQNEFLDKENNIVLRKGTKVSIGIIESETEFVIGQTNTAFVARSRDYQQPNMESIKRAWGLTSYLMGSNKRQSSELKSMIIDYFDPLTKINIETLNLGQDFRYSSKTHYIQRAYEVFSLRKGVIEVRSDAAFVDIFPPKINDEVLRITRFYHDKLNVEVEVEGCMTYGDLYIFQITESPLPKDVISHLTKIPKNRVLYEETYGRGAINYSGTIIIKENENFKKITKQFDSQGVSYLVIGFDDSVAVEDNFLYIASDESISNDVSNLTGGEKTGFGMREQHKWGITCQTTANAALEGRHGGMFYTDRKEFMKKLEPVIEEIDGVKIIRDICVEACLEGLRIYKL